MDSQIVEFLRTILPALITAAVFYGNTKARLDNLESNVKQGQDIVERLARLEEKISNFIQISKHN